MPTEVNAVFIFMMSDELVTSESISGKMGIDSFQSYLDHRDYIS